MRKVGQEKAGKLQSKLTKYVLAVVFIAFFLVFLIVLNLTYSSYRQREIDNQRNILDKTASSISTWQKTIENISNQVIYDETIQSTVRRNEPYSGEQLYHNIKSQSVLARYTHIIDGVYEIFIYTDDGKTYSSRDVRDPFRPKKNSWYQEFLNGGKKSGYSGVYTSEGSQDGTKTEIFSYVDRYFSLSSIRAMGNLVVSIDHETLLEMTKMETNMLKGYRLYNDGGNILVEEGIMDLTYEEIIEQNKDGYIDAFGGDIFIISTDLKDNWLLVSQISGSVLLKQAIKPCLWILILFIGVALVLILLLRYSIRQIVKPINQLRHAAEEVGHGNFDVSVSIHTQDELEMFADVFNKMVVDIQKFTHESVYREKMLRRMQIENLMLQINPHFIYNTVNSIVYMARMSGNEQIAEFANAFVTLLQGTLVVRDSVYNSVRNELNSVENYLILQSYRYADTFEHQIICSEDLKDCQILNVMIQPAVENAIFHGIAPKGEKCHLLIAIHKTDQGVRVVVEDDGIGMSEETLAEIMKPEHTQSGGVRKIGVANVRSRIEEIFGEPYTLKIESELNIGTRVIMEVPYEKIEKNETEGKVNG